MNTTRGCLAALSLVAVSAMVCRCEERADSTADGAWHLPLYRSSYFIIDSHGHGPFPSEDAVRAHLAAMNRVGVDVFTVLLFEAAGWQYKGGWSESNLEAWLEIREEYRRRLIVCGTVDFGRAAKEPAFFENIVRDLKRHAKMGIQGIKIWKNLGMYHRDSSGKLMRIDDPRLDPFWATCGELGLPVWIHSADPKPYWYLEYFETDHEDLTRPYGDLPPTLSGVELPPEVLGKFYHGNAERLIPGLGD